MSYQENTIQDRSIPIRELHLYPRNPRLVGTPYFDQSEDKIIHYFCQEPIVALETLATRIVQRFGEKRLERILVCQEHGKNIVAEGNRRVAIYKLLDNPSLAPSEALRNKYRKLKDNVSIDGDFMLECVVMQRWDTAFPLMEEGQTDSDFRVRWTAEQRAYFSGVRGHPTKKDKLILAFRQFMKKSAIPDSLSNKVLGPGFEDIFRRVALSRFSQEKFGLTVNEHGALEATDMDFDKKLTIMVVNIASKKDFRGNIMNSHTLNERAAITYLNSITEKDYSKALDTINNHQGSQQDFWGTKEVSSYKNKNKSYADTATRRYLIPSNFSLAIEHPRIRNIFSELKKRLPLEEIGSVSKKNIVPNAVGVLFRVFLEISLDYFWEKKVGKIFSTKIGMRGKIMEVANYMEEENIAREDQLINIRKVRSDKSSILSIDNFHRHVHSHRSSPIPSDLKLTWDNLQEFFEILWLSLSSKN